jgi:hypothetical protein
MSDLVWGFKGGITSAKAFGLVWVDAVFRQLREDKPDIENRPWRLSTLSSNKTMLGVVNANQEQDS